MKRGHLIALAAIILIGGLALAENLTRSVEVRPATITTITSVSPDKGPDLWTISARLDDMTDAMLEPQTMRPSQVIGDTICVRVHARSWADTKYGLAAGVTC